MSHRTRTMYHTWKERALSLLLAAVLLVGLAPGLALPAAAEHWADAYLDQLVDWGVIRADQTANPDAPLTRAEFMAIINRAYGYTEVGPIPFTDVRTTDWFYEDVCIAYTAGYMAGTSATTAEPNSTLTREQAVCILGRNMMLKETPGESLAFADSRDVSDWARGTIKTAVDNYIVSGHPDNTFRPLEPVSKAQMAVLVTQCIGTPVSQSGTHELGGVFGNVTITSPNVTLRNTTISGDLYISGGVGLGGIKLENVDVLGRIIVSGTGESEGGDASVIMRNVNAREMLVDNMRNKTVTIRADGITEIANTIVRTNAYLEDNNTDEKGLLNISLEGEPGTHLTLAGRIKNVVNKNPDSTIQVAKGSVAKLTVDESATNSTVQIDRNTEVKELNLDVATNVVGEGDIGQLNINAPGSVVTMLPDKIYIRPGLTANIAGVVMDHTAAEEGSTDPRLLSGYPAAKDIAPTGFRADFSGNKKGTVYWAVSSISDGSIGEEDLINPPSYGSKAIQGGSVAAPAGDTVVNAQVTGLTVAGSYYLSALLRDEQGRTSPVKVISFSTPDNTVPAFGQGYPYMSKISRDVAQVTVMPTKTCKLYYALLPQGAQAPTVNELKSAAVKGNLGYGIRDVNKNEEEVFTVNNQRLEELKNYVLYLWLTDVDGANSSAVQSLQFVVPDQTPPEFTVDLYVNGNAQATSVPMAATLNENGTIFWAVVEEGAEYPLPNLQSDPLSKDNIIDPDTNRVISSKLDSDYAKLCVRSGMKAISRGQVTARADTEVTFNITGLQAEKAYDLYYLAQDTAGNYTVQVYKLTGGLHTLDVNGPVITQSFSSVPSRDDPNSPMSSTDIILEFSENIRCSTSGEGKDFLTLYNNRNASDADMKLFTDALKASIVLHRIDPDSGGGSSKEVVTWAGSKLEPTAPEGWVVDYSKVTITAVGDGRIQITFPGIESSPTEPAVKLANGAQYYFEFRDITDASTAMNKLDPYNNRVNYSNAEEKHTIPTFTTVFSQVLMTSVGVDDLPEWKGTAVSGQLPSDATLARADLNFRLNPQSTKNTDDSNRYDMLIYSDTSISYDLYYRITDKQGNAIEKGGTVTTDYADNLLTPRNVTPAKGTPDANGWRYLGNKAVTAKDALSLGHDFIGCTETSYPQLNKLSEELYYEFVISVTKNGILTNYKDFNGQVEFEIYIEAGRSSSLHTLGQDPTQTKRQEAEDKGLSRTNGVANIGLDAIEGTRYLRLPAIFPNTQAPSFYESAPWFSANANAGVNDLKYYEEENKDGSKTQVPLVGDTYAYLQVNMDTAGTIHYVISRRTTGLLPTLEGVPDRDEVWKTIPRDGLDTGGQPEGLTSPEVLQIAEHNRQLSSQTFPNKDSVAYESPRTLEPILVNGLTADTDYYIYFVLEAQTDGSAPGERSQVYVYKFRTAKTTKPRITLTDSRQGYVTISTGESQASPIAVSADLNWIVFTQAQGETALSEKFEVSSTGKDPAGNSINVSAILPTPTGKQYPSLLDALTTPYLASTAYGTTIPDNATYGTDYNGLTVFDVFASTTQRQYVERLITSTPPGIDIVNKKPAETRPADYSDTADWAADGDNVQPIPMTYLILASGHNVGSNPGTDGSYSSVNSFSARTGVVLQDMSPPNLLENNGVIGNITLDANGKLSGTIILSFDKEVYWRKSSGDSTYYAVKGVGDGNNDPTGTGTSATVGLLYKALPNSTSLTAQGGSRTFSISFDDLEKNETYTIFNEGQVAAYQGNETPATMTIRISKGDASSGGLPYFTVTFRGRGGTVTGERENDPSTTTTGTPTAPYLSSANLAGGITGQDSGFYSFNLALGFNTFDNALYYRSGNSGTQVTSSSLVSGASYRLETGGTASAPITASGSLKNYSLQIKSMKPGTITLMPDKTLSDKTGAATTQDKVIITLSEMKSGGFTNATVPCLEVKFGTKTWRWEDSKLVSKP